MIYTTTKIKHREAFIRKNYTGMTSKEMAAQLTKREGIPTSAEIVYSICQRLKIKATRKSIEEKTVDRPPAIYSNENSYLSTMQKYSQL